MQTLDRLRRGLDLRGDSGPAAPRSARELARERAAAEARQAAEAEQRRAKAEARANRVEDELAELKKRLGR